MNPSLICLADPASPAAEAYRRLRVNLLAAGRQAPLQTLLVVAAGDDDQKAAVVGNLAITFARVGKRVIVVDGDLRTPGQHVLFGLSNDSGLTTAVQRPGEPLPLRSTAVDGLRVLTSGPAVGSAADLLASSAMSEVITRLREEADLVLFDVPSMGCATDAAELASVVDGVLLTISAGQTKRAEAQEAKNSLSRVGARLVGAALINV